MRCWGAISMPYVCTEAWNLQMCWLCGVWYGIWTSSYVWNHHCTVGMRLLWDSSAFIWFPNFQWRKKEQEARISTRLRYSMFGTFTYICHKNWTKCIGTIHCAFGVWGLKKPQLAATANWHLLEVQGQLAMSGSVPAAFIKELLQVRRRFRPCQLGWWKFMSKNCGCLVIYSSRWFQTFYFHPYLGKIPMLTNIFSKGLKPPTSHNRSMGWWYIFPSDCGNYYMNHQFM